MLYDILHTPQATASLLFVHKLCSDNDVFVEFHTYYFFIKDKHLKKVLLQGPIDKGFYKVYDAQDAS